MRTMINVCIHRLGSDKDKQVDMLSSKLSSDLIQRSTFLYGGY